MTPSFYSMRGAPLTRRERGYLLVISILAFEICLLAFTPKFHFWNFSLSNLVSPKSHSTLSQAPEVSRALQELKQLENPFVSIDSPFHKVIEWRLLFPVVWHLLKLPVWSFFLMPFVGVLLLIYYIACLLYQQMRNFMQVGLCLLLVSTTSPFLISTHFLGNFDVWVVLMLLLVSFSPSVLRVFAASFCAPWIDERFLLVVVLAWMVRHIYFQLDWKASVRVGVVVAVALLPYILLRVFDLLTNPNTFTINYFKHGLYAASGQYGRKFLGLWHGLRAAWIPALLSLVFVFKSETKWFAILFSGVAAMTLMINLQITMDYSRACMVLIPIIILGVFFLSRLRSSIALGILLVLAVFNLCAPAGVIMKDERIYFQNAWLEYQDAQRFYKLIEVGVLR